MKRPLLTPLLMTQAVRLAFMFYLGVLVMLLLGPFERLEEMIPLPDKVLHAIAFYGLASLMFVAMPRNRRFDMALGLLLIGGGTELLQALVGRDADFYDFIADAAGVAAAVLPNSIERLRKLTRDAPSGPLLKLWNTNRRRRAPSTPRDVKWVAAAKPVRWDG